MKTTAINKATKIAIIGITTSQINNKSLRIFKKPHNKRIQPDTGLARFGFLHLLVAPCG